MSGETRATGYTGPRRIPEWVALGLHVLVGVFPYGASGLLAPIEGLVVLALVWIALAVVLWRWRPRNPWVTLLVPVWAVALWFLVLTIGEALFGWQA